MNNSRLHNMIDFVKNHKIAFIAAGTFLLFVLVIIAFLPQQPTTSPSGNTTITTTPGQTSEVVNGKISIAPSNVPKWKNNTRTDFTFKSPPDWTIQRGTTTSGGEVILLLPANLPPGLNYPRFMIESVPYTITNAATKVAVLQGMGLVESATTVDSIPARKFNGMFGAKVSNGQTINEPIQETAIVFQYNNKLYTLKYNYEGDTVSPELEAYFADIISSMKFK